MGASDTTISIGSESSAGFTLIELLIMIAIVIALAALLFPVFSAVKERGTQAVCLNNLRQLGRGIQLYTDEWGHYPTVRLDVGGHGNPRGNWAGVYEICGKCDPRLGQVFPYVRNVNVYLCPDDRGRKPRQISDPNALPYPLSYSMNDITDYRSTSTMENHASRVGLLIHESRDTIDDGDFYWYGWYQGGGHNKPSRVHNGGTCVLYCDLHARWQTFDQVLDALHYGEWDPLQ